MNEGERKIIVTIMSTGAAKVSFLGGHLSKRELERALKAVKSERNRKIREFNQKQMYTRAKEEAEAQVKKEKGIEDGKKERSESSDSDGKGVATSGSN